MTPILARTGQGPSVTEGWRALDLFTDRLRATRRFATYLNDDPAPESILFFCADGGTGKSLLLRFLAERCTVRLPGEAWNRLREVPDREFREQLLRADAARPLPYATLDLGAQPHGEDRPQEAFSGLLMLRRALAVHKIAFPLFDFACLRYLQLTSGLSQERIQLLFPAAEHGFVGDIVRSLSLVHPAPEALMGLIERRMGKSFAVYSTRRRLDRARVEEIERLEPRRELLDELPHLFADDLNAHLALPKAPPRVVLFFDSHDEIWGASGTAGPDELYFERDEWLRRLLASLDLEGGVVAVVAGRTPPRWPSAPKVTIPEDYLDVEMIDPLPAVDADDYLQRAGVADPDLRRSLTRYAEVRPGQAHPLYLGLCVDTVLAAERAGPPVTAGTFRSWSLPGDRGRALLNRLLRYVDAEVAFAVRALSACRAFDRDVFFHLGRELNFTATEPAFATLAGFSFVWRDDRRGTGFYRLHGLLRRVLREAGGDVVSGADAALEAYYRRLAADGDLAARAEAAYHANQLDPERGAALWLSVFNGALDTSHYELARCLLEVRDEMVVPDERVRGLVATLTGRFFAEGGHRYDEATQAYRQALAIFEGALAARPDAAALHMHRAGALFRLGEVQAEQSRHDAARTSYLDAVAAAERALQLDPGLAEAHRNRAAACMRLGYVEEAAGDSGRAVAVYQDAVASTRSALSLVPGDARAHNVAGLAHLGWGRAEAARGRLEEATAALDRAVAAFEEAARHRPGFAYAHCNAGTAWRTLGDLQARQGRDGEALESFELAVAAFDEALGASPDYARAHAGRGGALTCLGRAHARLGRPDGAADACRQALAATEEALGLAPGHVPAHAARAEALLLAAELDRAGGRPGDGAVHLEAARAACHEALGRAPGYAGARALARRLDTERGPAPPGP